MIKSDKKVGLEKLHWESTTWKSQFLHMDDELLFIERLLNSYVFEPNTPNLFERILDYKARIKAIKKNKRRTSKNLAHHESKFGGILECTDGISDEIYCKRHNEIKKEVNDCLSDFQSLKTEIFNYAGGILKKHKPDKNIR